MTVTIENLTRGMKTYNLAHANHQRTLRYLRVVEDKRGNAAMQRVAKNVSESLTLMAQGTHGSKRGGLPDTIAECPDIRAAVTRKELRVTKEQPATKAAPSPRAPASAPVASPVMDSPRDKRTASGRRKG